MKDLSNLVNNYKPITEHKQSPVIDDFAKSIIDRVFDNLAIIFPAWKHNWKSDDPNQPDKVLKMAKREWTKAFVENDISTLEQISCGFAKARRAETDFLPSCGKFISWCTPDAEDLGYPSEQKAMRSCVAYRANVKLGLPSTARPLIIELCKRVDWWLVNSANSQATQAKADKHFKEVYIALITSNYREPEETTHVRLETSEVTKQRMSPQQKEDSVQRGLDAMKAVRAKLKASKLDNKQQ